jgi:hypothetical protein
MPVPILPAVKPPAQTPARIDCRVRPRHACDLEASCQPVAARGEHDCQWPGTIRDISSIGVGLVLRRRFEPGSGLAIEVPAQGDRGEETLLARVRHATRLPDGRWLHGCSLISELSDDEMQRLLGRSGAQEPAAKAESGKPAALNDVTFQGLAEDGRTVAIRVKRLQPDPTWPLPAGTTLALRVGGEAGGRVRLVVKDSVQEGGNWVVHCRFLGKPRAEVSQALGQKQQ